MKAQVLAVSGGLAGEVDLPQVFETPLRADLIRRAVVVAQANRRTPYGTDPLAGTRTSAESWGVDSGVSRVPRIKSGNRGAHVPMAVGGRRAHPPKAEKVWSRRMNQKERHLALRSAVAATAHEDIVRARGHRFDAKLPIIVEDKLEELQKIQEIREFLRAAGLWSDVERARPRKVRAGKGKRRGRRYKRKTSLLLVASKTQQLRRAAGNLPGVEVVTPDQLKTELLAPGTHPGRLTLYTKSAMARLGERLGDRPAPPPKGEPSGEA
ncbi:MAG: 50S ribosomal protein L4 [Euryarchaeota archaeon]|nr:50S ribosomal protein L4 [Euryarchaeota archaeon]